MMDDPEDDGFPGFSPSEYGAPTAESELHADAYEQLKLTQEARRLETAKRRKFESLKPCLELARQRAELRLKIATENRLAAEAQRDRTKEARLLARERRKGQRDRRRAAEAEARTEEVKAQAAQEIARLSDKLREYATTANDEYEKRMWVEHRERLDPQTAEFLACPECGGRMGRDEQDIGLICPDCNHRKDLSPTH